MKLHRTLGKPDWAELKVSEYNQWQSVAASTKSVVTPGNIMTLAGFAVVLFGIRELSVQRYYLGALLLAVGRLCDLADGWLAEATGTKSPLGEMLDVVADKLGTLAVVIALGATHIVPWLPLLALLLPHVIITAITTVLAQRGRRLHPSRYGKLSMAAAWVSLVGFVVRKAAGNTWQGPLADSIAVVVVLSVGMGLYAAVGYLRGRD